MQQVVLCLPFPHTLFVHTPNPLNIGAEVSVEVVDIL